MNTLDRILAVPDKDERQSQLVKYARSLGADPVAAHQKGECNEEMLVLLIYDAAQKQKTHRTKDINFVGGGIVVLAILVALISTLPKLFVTMFQQEENAQPQGKTLQAFDKNGKPMLEDNQPVLYKLMDGVYHEEDTALGVKYEYTYQMGTMINKKTTDKNGKVIAEENYGGAKK